MKYYFEKALSNIDFDSAIERVTKSLKNEGFGILSEIDVKATMKKKLDEDFDLTRYLALATLPMLSKPFRQKKKLVPCYPAM